MVLVSQNAQFLHLVLSNLTIWFVLAEKFPAKVYVNQEKSLFDLHTLIKQSILLNLHELLMIIMFLKKIFGSQKIICNREI